MWLFRLKVVKGAWRLCFEIGNYKIKLTSKLLHFLLSLPFTHTTWKSQKAKHINVLGPNKKGGELKIGEFSFVAPLPPFWDISLTTLPRLGLKNLDVHGFDPLPPENWCKTVKIWVYTDLTPLLPKIGAKLLASKNLDPASVTLVKIWAHTEWPPHLLRIGAKLLTGQKF